MINLVGRKFGRLVVLRFGEKRGHDFTWVCRCSCGVVKEVFGGNLRGTKSCGCWNIECIKKRRTTHGERVNGRWTSEYGIWATMIGRCTNPRSRRYKHYGGRGITVCRRWRFSFSSFLKDVGRKPSVAHTLERVDNNKGYYPWNVRWATQKEQCRNTRVNRIVTIGGKSRCVAEWADIYGIRAGLVRGRLHRGWPDEVALRTPSDKRRVNVRT